MKTVLSIQSSVSLGGVGNTMANMVLSAMGHHIARVDTVQLAAHPGYGFVAGGRLNQPDFDALIDGLIRLQVWDKIDAVMTGYMAHGDQTAKIGGLIKTMKSHRPDLPVLVDPAIGDHGRLYVDASIAQGMADHLFDKADLITPNRFELGYFTGQDITDQHDAEAAGNILLARHHHMTGIAVTGVQDSRPPSTGIADGWIRHDGANFYEGQALIHQPKGLSGGGDLFSALVMGYRLNGQDWQAAVAKASAKAQQILHASDAPTAGDMAQGQILPQAIDDQLR